MPTRSVGLEILPKYLIRVKFIKSQNGKKVKKEPKKEKNQKAPNGKTKTFVEIKIFYYS